MKPNWFTVFIYFREHSIEYNTSSLKYIRQSVKLSALSMFDALGLQGIRESFPDKSAIRFSCYKNGNHVFHLRAYFPFSPEIMDAYDLKFFHGPNFMIDLTDGCKNLYECNANIIWFLKGIGMKDE